MKRVRPSFYLLIAIFIFVLSACDKNQNVPDPSGTKTQNFFPTWPAIIDTANAIYSVNNNNVSFYKNAVSLNDVTSNILLCSFDSGMYQQYSDSISYTGGCNTAICNLGVVQGLGAITSHPSTGYVGETNLKTGFGYVIKLVDNDPLYSTLTSPIPRTRYYRLYISGAITNTTSNGYTIKYQGPF